MDDPEERLPARAHSAVRIEVECLSCGRRGSLESDDARVTGAPLVHLTRRLRCSECGSRAVKAKTVRTPADLARLMRDRMGGPG